MESSWGKDQARPSGSTELVCFTTAAATVSMIATIGAFEHRSHAINISAGVYALLAAVATVSGVSWAVTYFVHRAERRVREHLSAQMQGLRAELLAALRCELAAAPPGAVERRSGCLPPCRSAGSTYVAAGVAKVDGVTDPGVRLAREAGIEEGFEIGLRAKLADLGVPTLPTARRGSRLTADS